MTEETTVHQNTTPPSKIVLTLAMICCMIAGVFAAQMVVISPAEQKRNDIERAFQSAVSVQQALRMQYALVAPLVEENLNLSHGYYDHGAGYLRKLEDSARLAGLWVESGYPSGSVGHALYLSNYVLTGDYSAKFLLMPEVRPKAIQRKAKLIEDVSLADTFWHSMNW